MTDVKPYETVADLMGLPFDEVPYRDRVLTIELRAKRAMNDLYAYPKRMELEPLEPGARAGIGYVRQLRNA